MSENNVIIHDFKKSNKTNDNISDGGGGSMDLEKRVERLETKFDKMDGKISSIEITLARIEAKLDTKASKEDVLKFESELKERINAIEIKLDSKASKEDLMKSEGELKSRISLVEGKVDSLPKWIQLISLTIFASGLIATMNFLLNFYLKSPVK